MNLIKLIAEKIRLLLVGPPGCGKTARIAAAAKTAGHRLVVLRASLSERVDLGGCLVPDTAAGITRALPLELLQDLQTTKAPTLFFLDDLGQAPVDVQAACMRLFDAGELSDQVLVWGATNRPGDKSGVNTLCEPLRSRFHLAASVATPGVEDRADGSVLLGKWWAPVTAEDHGECEVARWLEWAISQDFPAEVIAWHRSTAGQHLYGWKPHADPAQRMPDFRSWETVGRLMAAGIADRDHVSAAIGKAAALPFLAFCRLADQLATPEQVWMDPQGAPVPEDPSALFLMASNLSRAVEKKVAGAMCVYMGRMPRIYAALCARDSFRRLGAALSGNPEWQRWFSANQQLFVSNH